MRKPVQNFEKSGMPLSKIVSPPTQAEQRRVVKGNYVFDKPANSPASFILNSVKPNRLWSPKPQNDTARNQLVVAKAFQLVAPPPSNNDGRQSIRNPAPPTAPKTKNGRRTARGNMTQTKQHEDLPPTHDKKQLEVELCPICMEAVDEDENKFSCHKCSMSAHPACLRNWFKLSPSTINGSNARMLRRDGLTQTNVGCPGCRTPLDWDAMSLSANIATRRAREFKGLLQGGTLGSRICLNLH